MLGLGRHHNPDSELAKIAARILGLQSRTTSILSNSSSGNNSMEHHAVASSLAIESSLSCCTRHLLFGIDASEDAVSSLSKRARANCQKEHMCGKSQHGTLEVQNGPDRNGQNGIAVININTSRARA